MIQKIFNVAILGFGTSASVFHIPLILNTPGLKLTHIMSRQIAKIKQLLPEVIVINELVTILNDKNIDIVINTLPTDMHYQITKMCLYANKHVIVEKPFVINSADGEELIKLSQQKNLILSVFHNRRWDDGYLTLQKNSHKLGKIYLYEAYFDRYRPEVNLSKWRETAQRGSGILYDLGSHLIDQALNLFGNPKAIYADLTAQRQNAQAIDYFNITMWYGELRVILGSSSLIINPRPTVAAYGDQGSYVKYGLDPQENMLRNNIFPDKKNYSDNLDKQTSTLTSFDRGELGTNHIKPEQGNYLYYYQSIYKTLINYDEQLPVTPQSALCVIKLIESAIESNYTNSKIFL